MMLKEAWCKLSGLEKEVGTDDPDHLKAARALSAPGPWLGSNYAEVGQCIRCFKRSRGELSRYPIHPPHWHIAVSSKARRDATARAQCGNLLAHSLQIWETVHLPRSSTSTHLQFLQTASFQTKRSKGVETTAEEVYICNWHEYWLWKVAAELSRESC